MGAILRLLELGIEIEEVVGTSGGAICASALATFGHDKAKLKGLVLEVLPSKILKKNLLPIGGTKSLYGNEQIVRAFRTHFIEQFKDAVIPAHIVTHNWTRKKSVVWDKPNDDLPLATNASMCLPIFDMVEIGGDLYEDGGIDANFAIDFKDWTLKTDTPIVGIRMRSVGEHKPRPKPSNKIERVMGTINDLIDASDREHIEDANWAKIITIQTSFPGVKLEITKQEVEAMLKEGREAIDAAVRAGKLG